MKVPANALEGQLRARHRLDDFMVEVIDNALSIAAALDLCKKWGVVTSSSSISRLVRSYGLKWRLDRAKEAAQVTEKSSPPDIEEKIRRGLAQREFEAVFSQLSVKELVALKRCELAKLKVQNDTRRLALLEKKLAEAQGTLSDQTLSLQQREARLKEIFGKS